MTRFLLMLFMGLSGVASLAAAEKGLPPMAAPASAFPQPAPAQAAPMKEAVPQPAPQAVVIQTAAPQMVATPAVSPQSVPTQAVIVSPMATQAMSPQSVSPSAAVLTPSQAVSIPASPTVQPTAVVTYALLKTPSLQPTPELRGIIAPSDYRGFILGANLGQAWAFNSTPLEYGLHLGWSFYPGIMAHTGMESFYFEGVEEEKGLTFTADTRYSYNYINWTSSAVYMVPLKWQIEPYVGLAFEMITGQKAYAGVKDAKLEGARATTAFSAKAGFLWRPSEKWLLGASTRWGYAVTGPSFGMLGLDFYRLF
jgi:hypothetical protein